MVGFGGQAAAIRLDGFLCAAHVAEENGVQVRITAGEKPPCAMADPVRMTECFDELFANALHWFDKAEKRVDVAISTANKESVPRDLDGTKEYVRIVFADNGCGIPFDKKEGVFGAFYTTHPHGTGLGLSLVQRVVEGQGGLIREVGKPGEGAVFELYVPETAPAAQAS